MRFIIRPLIVLSVLAIAGIVGYVLIEGWTPLDAAYMVAITLSTVGFSEVGHISPGGRIFTMLLIVFGISTGAYAIGKLGESIVEGQIHGLARRRRMEHRIRELARHTIVCGFGRVGRQTCEELKDAKTPFVVIDQNADLEPELRDLGYLYVIGDASDDDVLLRAGIATASGVAVSTDADATTVFVTLTARSMNESARIVSVARSTESIHKLRRAGATKVISPFLIAGRRVAGMVLKPAIVDFLDTITERSGGELCLEELPLPAGSPLIGQSLAEAHLRRRAGVLVLGVIHPDGRTVLHPDERFTFAERQTMIAMGTQAQLEALTAIVNPVG